MSEQIPDAPYIREAERFGYPPFEEDPYPAKNHLDTASRELTKAFNTLAEVEQLLEGTRFSKEINEILDNLEEIDTLIDEMREEVLK